MLQVIMEMKVYYAALAVFLLVGVIGKFAEWSSMRTLLKASRNVKETENHSLIKQMKLGYTNAYKLNYGVNNTKAFIEKYLAKNKVFNIPADFISSLEEKMILLCGLSCLIAMLASVYTKKEPMALVFVTGVGVITVLTLRLFGTFFSAGRMKEQFMVCMVDYFENVLQNRLKNHRKDSGKISPVMENTPRAPKLNPNKSIRSKVAAGTQTAATQTDDATVSSAAEELSGGMKSATELTPEEIIVEEIIKEFFP